MSRLGILGGMGPAAGAQFLARVIALTPAAEDQAHIPAVLWSDPRIPPRRPGAPGPEPGAWRIELSPQREALSDRFLVVMLPAPLGDAPVHEISQFEEGLRLGLEIKGPQRITRWLFDRERGLAEVRVIEGAR